MSRPSHPLLCVDVDITLPDAILPHVDIPLSLGKIVAQDEGPNDIDLLFEIGCVHGAQLIRDGLILCVLTGSQSQGFISLLSHDSYKLDRHCWGFGEVLVVSSPQRQFYFLNLRGI